MDHRCIEQLKKDNVILTIKKINELWLNNNKIILINLSKPLQPELQIDTFKNEMKDLEKAEKLLKYLEEIEKEEE